MNSRLRFYHEAYTSLLQVMGKKLPVIEHPSKPWLARRETVQEAGTFSIDNHLESAFYPGNDQTVSYSCGDADFYHLKRASVVGDQGQVFLPDGSLFLPSVYPCQGRLDQIKIRRPIPFGAEVLRDPIFHLTGFNHENKGHFLLQHLPRILMARKLLESYPGYRILVAPGHQRWQTRFLQQLGFESHRIFEGSQGTLIAEDLLYVPLCFGSNGLNPPHFYREISTAAEEPPGGSHSGPSILVSRADAPDKRLLNEVEIARVAMEKIGPVEIVHLGKLTLSEQIQKFRHAPVILAPFGQGACNALFARNSTLVLLAAGEHHDSSYGLLTHPAALCGNRTITLVSGQASPAKSNWQFPVERFREQLHRLLLLPEMESTRRRLSTQVPASV
jgi:capsular polysaccharide biosynthesis protein